MIEVKQRSLTGILHTVASYTEQEFANQHSERNIREQFSNSNVDTFVGRGYLIYFGIWIPHKEFRKVAYNEKGKLLTVDYLIGIIRKHYDYPVWTTRRCKPNCPHPGKKRCTHWGTYYRRIRTFQERKWANAWDDEDFEIKVRKPRNASNLPNSWNDIVRTDFENRNWKRYRKHQWKG